MEIVAARGGEKEGAEKSGEESSERGGEANKQKNYVPSTIAGE
jgi:hypothetical protein